MTDTNTESGSQPDPGAGTRTPIWLRGLMMLLLAILIGLGQTVLHVLTVLQFILMLIEKGRPNQQIAGFGKDLGDWLAKAAAFQTAASEDKPWPWTR